MYYKDQLHLIHLFFNKLNYGNNTVTIVSMVTFYSLSLIIFFFMNLGYQKNKINENDNLEQSHQHITIYATIKQHLILPCIGIFIIMPVNEQLDHRLRGIAYE